MQQKIECDRSIDKTKICSWICGTRLSKNIWPFGNDKKKQNVYSTKVETWRYHHESLLCPVCNEHIVPIILTKRQQFSSSRFGATCLLGCWPLCLMPLMLSQERQARLVCPFCGHNYGNYVKPENKSNDSSFWHTPPDGGQQRLGEIMNHSKLNRPNQRESNFQPNFKLDLFGCQELWEVQDASQQTTGNAKEKEKELEIEEKEKEEEEEEEEGRDASVPKVFQNLFKETMSQHSEGCTFCSSQVTPDRCYEKQHFELSDLDYDSNWSTYNNNHYNQHHNHHPFIVHRKTRLYD